MFQNNSTGLYSEIKSVLWTLPIQLNHKDIMIHAVAHLDSLSNVTVVSQSFAQKNNLKITRVNLAQQLKLRRFH